MMAGWWIIPSALLGISMIAGLIIAGGRGLRMAGADKLTERLGPLPVIGHVVRALAPQVDMLAINANAAPERFEGLGLAIIADEKRFTGNPLAGLQAGLQASPSAFSVCSQGVNASCARAEYRTLRSFLRALSPRSGIRPKWTLEG